MPSHNPGTDNQKDDRSRNRPGHHGSPDDQESQDSHKGSSKGKNDNPGNFTNEPDRARKSGPKGGQS
jgi:hypothetical protein